MQSLEKLQEGLFLLPREGKMRVPGLLVANDDLLKDVTMERALEQVKNVAHLPGIVGHSIAMPDIHWGYGFPIGGVAATNKEEGVISPGGVGYDINCGVRLAILPIVYQSIKEKTREYLLRKLFQIIPSGMGNRYKKSKKKQRKSLGLEDADYQAIAEKGILWSVEQGYGLEEDIFHCENQGCIPGGNLDAVSQKARARGKAQLGTLGSGNHFLEIGEVDTILSDSIAQKWGIEKSLTYLLIHSGSRGFGHQICQDTLNQLIEKGYHRDLPDPQLVAAPIQSEEGQRYFAAMAVAANFAFNNRQHIFHQARMIFNEIFGLALEEVKLLYDVCHNIARFEKHMIDGKMQEVCVHRKGATRAFGPGAPDLSAVFSKTGQPVLVPGDMGTASFLLAGHGNPLTFASACHGAGRARSRIESRRAWDNKNVIAHMKQQGTLVMASSKRTISEEMPNAYKNVDDVVQVVTSAKLAAAVARLRPSLVIKG